MLELASTDLRRVVEYVCNFVADAKFVSEQYPLCKQEVEVGCIPTLRLYSDMRSDVCEQPRQRS